MKKLIYLITVFIAALTLTGAPQASAQTPVPVQTFTATHSALMVNSSSSLPPAERCTRQMNLYGAKPTAAGTYPLVLYVPGTYGDYTDAEGKLFVQHAAAQGFVAVAVEYDSTSTNNLAGYQAQAYCMFDQSHPNSALTNACAVSGADCSRGALVAGFSQGGAISVIAKNYTPNVNAVWTLGVSANIYPNNTIPTNAIAAPGGTRALPNNKLVMNIGQATNIFTRNLAKHDLPSMKSMTGGDCGTSFQCLQANGSGYYVVANSEVADNNADHCYWYRSCSLSPNTLEAGFQHPSTTNWSLVRNLDWLRSQLAI